MSAQHSEDFLRLAAEAKKQIKELPPADALKLVDEGAVLLDVREKDEFEKDHLAPATHLSRGLLEMKAHEVAPNKLQPVVCYCSGGNRGALAAATLKQMGYTQVFSIEGGLDACRAAQGPLSTRFSSFARGSGKGAALILFGCLVVLSLIYVVLDRSGSREKRQGRRHELHQPPASLVPLSVAEAERARLIYSQRCAGCHESGRDHTIGPILAGVGERRSVAKIQAIILNGKGRNKALPMPAGLATAEEAGLLAHWLASGGIVTQTTNQYLTRTDTL